MLGTTKRRTTRVSMPVEIRLQNNKGDIIPAETLMLNMHGASIRADNFHVPVGDDIEIYVPITGRRAVASVVSFTNNELAIELHQPKNIWGIVLPPEDWYSYMDTPKNLES